MGQMDRESAAKGVPRWPATVALLAVGVLLALVSSQLTLGPSWLPLAVILVLSVPLTIASLWGRHEWRRMISFVGLVTITIAVAAAAIFLIRQLVEGPVKGSYLLTGAGAIWAANLLTFAIWYWEIDGDGPMHRHQHGHRATDFLFPQQATGRPFAPGFVDYLFLAFGFATALSPADTAPLTPRAKLLMMSEALISITVIALLIARSVNIL